MEGLDEEFASHDPEGAAAPSGASGVVLSGDPGEFAKLGFKENYLN